MKRQTKQKSKKVTRTKRVPSSQEYKTAVQPLGSTVVRRQPGHSFGSAPPHDDFPEGGMRISGSCRVPLGVGHASGNDPTYGGWLATSGTAYSCFLPVGLDYVPDPTFWGNAPSAFGSGLLNVAFQFKKYRIRNLVLRYVPTCPSTTIGRVSFNFDRDAPSGLIQTASNTTWTGTEYVDDSRISISTPLWQQVSFELIKSVRPDRDDTLFYVGAGEVALAAGYGSSELRLAYQGAMGCYLSVPVDAASTTYGRVFVDYTIDLYDFNAGGITQLDLRRAPGRKTVEEKGDSKTHSSDRDKDSVRTQDVEFGAILVKSRNETATRPASADGRGSWFAKS